MPIVALFSWCALVFAASWGIQFAAIENVGDLEKSGAVPYLIAAMFTPTIVTLLFAVFSKTVRSSLTWRPTWATLPLCVVGALVPAAIAFGVVGIATVLNWGHSGWFSFAAGGVTISGGPWVLGLGAQPWPAFLANVAVTGMWFALFNATVAVGEEFGWRGFLQGHLIARMGTTDGIVLLGFIWSMWHLPSLLAGYNFPEYPLLGATVLFPLQLIAASFFLGWLTLRAGSFWPAAIAHGSTNSIQEGVTANLQLSVPRIYEDVTTLALEVLVGLLCWAALDRLRRGEEVRAV